MARIYDNEMILTATNIDGSYYAICEERNIRYQL